MASNTNGYINRLTAIIICILLQMHHLQGQRPMLNSSTAPSSVGIGSPAPSFMPTPRPRSDAAQIVYKPSPPETTREFSNSRTGKFMDLKEQMRKNGTHLNSHINHFHDTTYSRNNHNKMMISPIDRLRKNLKMNKTQVANTMGDTPDFRPYRKNDPLKSLQTNNLRNQVS